MSTFDPTQFGGKLLPKGTTTPVTSGGISQNTSQATFNPTQIGGKQISSTTPSTPAPKPTVQQDLASQDTGYLSGLGARTASEELAGGNKIASSIEEGSQDLSKGIQMGGVKGVAKGAQGLAESAFGSITGAAQSAFAPVTAIAAPVIKAETPYIIAGLKKLYPNVSYVIDKLSPSAQSVLAPKLNDFAQKHPNATGLMGDIINTALLAMGGSEAETPVKESLTKDALSASKDTIKEGVADAATAAKEKIASIGKPPEGQKAFDTALKMTREKMTPKLEQEAFNQGRVGKQGLFKGAPVAPSAAETKVAEAVQPLIEEGKLKPKMDPSEQSSVIKQRVSQINQGVKDMVAKPENNQPFTRLRLMKKLNEAAAKNRLIFAGDETAQKAYDAVVDEFKGFVKKNNVEGLLDARQNFDGYIRNNFPEAFKPDMLTGKVNPRVQALRDVRTSANEMAADLLDESQTNAVKRIMEPTQAKPFIERARNFPKKSDFIRYVNENPQEFEEGGLASKTQRKTQATQNTKNQYTTTKDEDLGELWDIAHTNYNPTAGKTFTDMIRTESHLMQASENISTTIKGITKTGKVQQFLKSPTGKVVGGLVGIEGLKKAVTGNF